MRRRYLFGSTNTSPLSGVLISSSPPVFRSIGVSQSTPTLIRNTPGSRLPWVPPYSRSISPNGINPVPSTRCHRAREEMQASRAGLEVSYKLSASGQQVNPAAWTKRACLPWAIRSPRDLELLDALELDAFTRARPSLDLRPIQADARSFPSTCRTASRIRPRQPRRHSSAMLDSPRKPFRTMRNFSSVAYCLRVARRMLFTRRSDGELGVADFFLISVPSG